ncbi:hypothetical protein B296_00043253 [Ensete ventricosum]|uniref:Uncharacterized protein n=1 Tax=Ensete ventricosum TaxID=4639 RepID=A0A426XI54_ENSVE|nr:hypothetical protein B296_00043253 [Ensete ventricosum]
MCTERSYVLYRVITNVVWLQHHEPKVLWDGFVTHLWHERRSIDRVSGVGGESIRVRHVVELGANGGRMSFYWVPYERGVVLTRGVWGALVEVMLS